MANSLGAILVKLGLDAAEFELRLGEFHELLPAAATGADGGR